MTSQLPSLISTSALGTRKARYSPAPGAPTFAATSTQLDSELPDPNAPGQETRNPSASAVATALGANAAQQATGPWPNTSSRPSAGRPAKAVRLMMLQREAHQPAEPSARAISSTVSKKVRMSAPKPP